MSASLAPPAPRLDAGPLLSARGLVKTYAVRRGVLQRRIGAARAVDGVDLDLLAGECLALVGESGSGKTTVGRLLTRLVEPDAGSIQFQGTDLLALRGEELRRRRRDFQVVFQDPWTSLNPRLTIGDAIREPVLVHRLRPRAEQSARVDELLTLVGLSPELRRRYPHELSGGQRQRVGIARALATEPRLLVADEPVSALDVSVRAQIVNLLAELQRRLGLTLLFIAHDLALVEQLADRVAVMYLGKIAELGPCADVLASPQHPYTVSLLASVPVPEAGTRPVVGLRGEPPSPVSPPSGCRFHPRCPLFVQPLPGAAAGGGRPRCATEDPPLGPAGASLAACHYAGEWNLRRPSRRRGLMTPRRGRTGLSASPRTLRGPAAGEGPWKLSKAGSVGTARNGRPGW